MRNSAVVVLGMALVMAVPVSGSIRTDRGGKVSKDRYLGKVSEMRESGTIRMAPEMSKKLKWGKTKTYGWNGWRWMPDDTYTYTYDKDGNIVVEDCKDAEGDYTRTVSEYNGSGMVTFKETKVSSDGVNYSNYSKTETEYDPILTKVITKNSGWMWMADEWQKVTNNYERRITRDEDGNITSVVIAVLFNGVYDPTQRLDIKYGEDGKAVELSEQILNFDYSSYEYFWEQGTRITDIVWDRTDGQIYDIEDLFMGNNRLKSGLYEDKDGLMEVTVEYEEDSEAYTVTMSVSDSDEAETATTRYTPLENNGYILEMKSWYMDSPVESVRREVRIDDWGLTTLDGTVTEDAEGLYSEITVGEVVYDEEGKPSTYTVRQHYTENSGEEEEYNVLRAEFSDYVDVAAAVSSVTTAGNAPKCYDLKGLPVAAPEKGSIVITEAGKKVVF